MDSTHLYIRNDDQLFVDNALIEATMDLTRRWYSPVKDPLPVITKDRPWEHIPYIMWGNYCTLRDPEDGLFKCWYEDLELRNTGSLTDRWFGACQCYAESEDGINWRKPELDVREVDGRRTNIVIGGDERGEVHSAYVVLDPHPSRLEDRFRMLYTLMPGGPDRIECAHSPDGIHWSVYEERPVFGIDHLDDAAIIFYDELSRCFVLNTRHFYQWAVNPQGTPTVESKPLSEWRFPNNWAQRNRRRVWQTYSHDFINWSEPVLMADVDDDEDNLDVSYYAMSQCKIGTLALGFAGLFHIVDNTTDVRLLSSRDGRDWRPCNHGQPFLSPGGDESWERYMIAIGSPPVDVGDEHWFFYGGSKCHHDWWMLNSVEDLDHPEAHDPETHAVFGLGRAVLRKNGFASLQANRLREGILMTRSLISKGTELVLNGRCAPGGYVRAEVLDANNNPIQGFEKQNCDVFDGDSVTHTVTWKGQSRIPYEGDDLFWRRLRFFLRDAEIFSFRLTSPDESARGLWKWGQSESGQEE